MTIKGKPTKTIRYEFDGNNRLKFLTDENNIKIELIYDESGNLTSFKFPDGGEAILQWNSSTSCKTVEGVKLKSPNGIERQLAGNCEDEMEQAAWAATIASYICGTNGSGAACYAAMANLGYRTYRAYRACR